MKDAQKIALIASFLLRYPDEQWYNELPEWREDAQSVGHPQLRQGLLEFFDYVEESDKKEFEDQYVRTFDFSQNTTMYLSTYELQGTGEQAEEIYDYCKPKLEYIRERFIEAKLPYAFLFDIILSVANGLEDGAR